MKKNLICLLLWLLVPSIALGATSHVQTASGRSFVSNTAVASWSSGTSAGNLIACMAWWQDNTSTVDTVVDSVNGTLTDSGLGVHRLNSAHSAQMFYMENINGGTASNVTLTMAGGATPSAIAIACSEVSGRASSGALDQKQFGDNNYDQASPFTDDVTSGTVTTTTDGQYVFGATRAEFGTSVSAGTGFTLLTSGTDNHIGVERLNDDQASAGNTAATFTPAANDGWITGIMTFKAASGGGGGPDTSKFRRRIQ